jgi:hypothetical protein
MPDMPTPAAALTGEDANSAVVILREKIPTGQVSHKVVAFATIFLRFICRRPLLLDLCLTGETQGLLQQPKVALPQSGQGSVAKK